MSGSIRITNLTSSPLSMEGDHGTPSISISKNSYKDLDVADIQFDKMILEQMVSFMNKGRVTITMDGVSMTVADIMDLEHTDVSEIEDLSIQVREVATAPDTIPGKTSIYAKADTKTYMKDSAGAELCITDGVSGGSTHPTSDGTSHSHVVLNDSHRTGNGSDHADVSAATGNINSINAVLSAKKKYVYVDRNRVDLYTEDGSETRPFKSINGAVAVAVADDVIKVAPLPGGYTEDVVLPNGVSMEGYGANNCLINGDVTTGTLHCSLKYMALGGVAKTLTINGPCSIVDLYSGNSVAINNAVQAWNFHVATVGVPALVLNNALARIDGVLCGFDTTGPFSTILGTLGIITLNMAQVTNNDVAVPTINSVAGALQLLNTGVINMGGGPAILANNGAGPMNPNGLHGVMTVGISNFGAAVTMIDYVQGAPLVGAALAYNPGAFLATGAVGVVWAMAAPLDRSTAIDRIAAALATLLPPGGIA